MILPSEYFPVSATIRVTESPKPKKNPIEVQAVLGKGKDIYANPSLLHEYCFASPTNEAVDFITILGSIWFADRAIRRQPAKGWGRFIRLSIPVLEPGKWSKLPTVSRLQECLDYLTGDKWALTFTKRRRAPVGTHGSSLVQLPQGEYIGVPYSGGIDSYSQVKLLLSHEPRTNLICTFTSTKASAESWQALCKSNAKPDRKLLSIPIPMRVTAPRHSEMTFRTRPFVFYGLAAYAAVLAGSKRVLIPENGQGSLGGSLALLGNEHPHRSCYPGFPHRLREVLALCLGKEIVFEHPGLMMTKGQVIEQLARKEPSLDWSSKWSCAHDQRHSNLHKKRVHCGVCGGCILRRMSMNSAGINEKTEYLFADLGASTIEASLPKGKKVKAFKAMKDVAGNSARDMQRLASFAGDANNWEIQQVAMDVSDFKKISPQEALKQVLELFECHRGEWSAFLQKCGSSSWLRELALA